MRSLQGWSDGGDGCGASNVKAALLALIEYLKQYKSADPDIVFRIRSVRDAAEHFDRALTDFYCVAPADTETVPALVCEPAPFTHDADDF